MSLGGAVETRGETTGPGGGSAADDHAVTADATIRVPRATHRGAHGDRGAPDLTRADREVMHARLEAVSRQEV